MSGPRVVSIKSAPTRMLANQGYVDGCAGRAKRSNEPAYTAAYRRGLETRDEGKTA